MDYQDNVVSLVGRLEWAPVLSHECKGNNLYTTTIKVMRQSGVADYIPAIIPSNMLPLVPRDLNRMVMYSGQIRTYDLSDDDGVMHLFVGLFVRRISEYLGDDNTYNRATVSGVICKRPVFRVTPFGREIADITLAVHRPYGKSDYIPCIAWGHNARAISGMAVGDRVWMTGRFQSREYGKLLDDGKYEIRKAYELSAFQVHPCTDAVVGGGY